jgi:CTP:molybdopterin cytidylyltransferase MocA
VSTRVAGVVLAAGRGERLGGDVPKPLAQLEGEALVTRALDAIVEADLSPILLVVGRHGGPVADAAPQGVVIVHAPRWHEGIAHSLHAALETVIPYTQVSAICVGLADQPLVGAESYRRLVAAHQDGATLAVATYGETRGNPVLLARSLWDEALALAGDVGARALMANHDVVEVDCTDTGSPQDVDTIDDLHALEQQLAAERGQPS